MTEVKVVSKIISQGRNRWRSNEDGTWDCLMFGSFPDQRSPGLIWRWVEIESDRVPDEVKKVASLSSRHFGRTDTLAYRQRNLST